MKTISIRTLVLATTFIIPACAQGQEAGNRTAKVSHAEPLYYDLVRDLGARKGEKEWNIGTEFINQASYSKNTLLVEYEFAPVNRLGLEAEADFSFFKGTVKDNKTPANKLEDLKLSAQYSFFVSPVRQTTLAIGYTQGFTHADFPEQGKTDLFTGLTFSPFFVAAKRWQERISSLIFVYPVIEREFQTGPVTINWQLNTSVHYHIPQSGNLVGIEFNHEFNAGKYELVIPPQVKVKLNKHTAIGVVAGLPVHKATERFSSFFRLIYEP